jgi:hypothetical protein
MDFCQGLGVFILVVAPIGVATRASVAGWAESDGGWRLSFPHHALSLRSHLSHSLLGFAFFCTDDSISRCVRETLVDFVALCCEIGTFSRVL